MDGGLGGNCETSLEVLKGQSSFEDSGTNEEENSVLNLSIEEDHIRAEKHSRTPSSTVLTDLVDDIRTIFSNLGATPKRKRESSGDKTTKLTKRNKV